MVPPPVGPRWKVWRAFDARERAFLLGHTDDSGASDQWVAISEHDGALALPSRESLVAVLSSNARKRLADPAAAIEEIVAPPPERFGASSVLVALRARESDAKAGLLRKRAVFTAYLAFVPPEAPDRTCAIRYIELGMAAEPDRLADAWHALLDGIELRPADQANVEAAARADDFPKSFEPGLARRSLTLPQLGFQLGVGRERWLAPGGFTGWGRVAFGITDHLELDTPAFLRYAFGEVEALTRPEVAVGAGLTGFLHDAERGSVWGFGGDARVRKRLGSDVALRGLVLGEGAYESRTGRLRSGGAANAGVVWDVLPWLTLGIEAGWSSRPWTDASSKLVWVGGRATPLATVHVPFVDLGLTGAAAWDRGHPGALVGLSFLLTL